MIDCETVPAHQSKDLSILGKTKCSLKKSMLHSQKSKFAVNIFAVSYFNSLYFKDFLKECFLELSVYITDISKSMMTLKRWVITASKIRKHTFCSLKHQEIPV